VAFPKSRRVKTRDITRVWRMDLERDRRTDRSGRSTAKHEETVFVTCDLIEASESMID